MDYPEHSFKAMTYMGWNYMIDNFIFPQKFSGWTFMLLVQVSDQFENIDQHKLENRLVNNDEEQTGHIHGIKSATVNCEDEITKEQHADLIDIDYQKKSDEIEVRLNMNQVTESLFRLAITYAEQDGAVQPEFSHVGEDKSCQKGTKA